MDILWDKIYFSTFQLLFCGGRCPMLESTILQEEGLLVFGQPLTGMHGVVAFPWAVARTNPFLHRHPAGPPWAGFAGQSG
jgi:hypothetical protein